MTTHNGDWCDHFFHVGHNGNVPTTAGGVVIPTGDGNWIAQSVNAQGQVVPIDGEPGAPGIIELRSNNTADSQLVLYKGLKSTAVDPIFGTCPANLVRCIVFRMRIPGSFNDNMGFRLTLTNRALFPDAAGFSIGFFYDHDTTPGGTSDPLVHVKTRATGSPEFDTPGNAPTPGGWIDYVISQETPGEIKFYMGNVLLATHTGPSVPDIAALLVSIQVFNRTSGVKKIQLDATKFRPVCELDLPECPTVYEQAQALSQQNGVYVVGRGADFYPNVLEAVQAINSSGNPPSIINRTCIQIMPGQYIGQTPAPLSPVPIPSYVTVRGWSFTTTELYRPRFVVDGTNVAFEQLFITGEDPSELHFDMAGNSVINFTAVQHLGKGKLFHQSGDNWRTIGFKDCGSSFTAVAGWAGEMIYTGAWVGGSQDNRDTYFQNFACDVFYLSAGGGGGGGVRTDRLKDFRVMGGEVRTNNYGACWRLDGTGGDARFNHHLCNNRLGSFPLAHAIVSAHLAVEVDNCTIERCTTPGLAAFNPAPANSLVTYVA